MLQCGESLARPLRRERYLRGSFCVVSTLRLETCGRVEDRSVIRQVSSYVRLFVGMSDGAAARAAATENYKDRSNATRQTADGSRLADNSNCHMQIESTDELERKHQSVVGTCI
jgi:hypothetical protein